MIPTPTQKFDRIFDIPIEFLKENKIKLVLLDLDNTLTPWHDYVACEKTVEWVNKVKQQQIAALILTNGRGRNAQDLAQKLEISVVSNAKKPFCRQIKRCLKEQNVQAAQALIIGDQLFTDILAANRAKTKSVLLEPISKREWWATKVFNRTRERLVGRKIKYFE